MFLQPVPAFVHHRDAPVHVDPGRPGHDAQSDGFAHGQVRLLEVADPRLAVTRVESGDAGLVHEDWQRAADLDLVLECPVVRGPSGEVPLRGEKVLEVEYFPRLALGMTVNGLNGWLDSD